jgi:hypothetical protein
MGKHDDGEGVSHKIEFWTTELQELHVNTAESELLNNILEVNY